MLCARLEPNRMRKQTAQTLGLKAGLTSRPAFLAVRCRRATLKRKAPDELPRPAKQLRKELDDERLYGFIVTHPANLRYLCGYTGSNGLLLFFGGRPVFFTDGRYTQQARAEVLGRESSLPKARCLRRPAKSSAKEAGKIGYEADHTTVPRQNAGKVGPEENHLEANLRPDHAAANHQGRRRIEPLLRTLSAWEPRYIENALLRFSCRSANRRSPGGWSSPPVKPVPTVCRSRPLSQRQTLCSATRTRYRSATSPARICGSRFWCCTARLLLRHDAHRACWPRQSK